MEFIQNEQEREENKVDGFACFFMELWETIMGVTFRIYLQKNTNYHSLVFHIIIMQDSFNKIFAKFLERYFFFYLLFMTNSMEF